MCNIIRRNASCASKQIIYANMIFWSNFIIERFRYFHRAEYLNKSTIWSHIFQAHLINFYFTTYFLITISYSKIWCFWNRHISRRGITIDRITIKNNCKFFKFLTKRIIIWFYLSNILFINLSIGFNWGGMLLMIRGRID